MGILLTMLIWLLIALAGLLLVLLVVPIQLRAEGEIDGLDATGELAVRWGWGFLGFRMARGEGAALYFLGLRVYQVDMGDKDKEKEKREKEKKPGEKRGASWGWRNRRFIFRLVRGLHLRGWLRGTIGTGDPADTALFVQQLFQPLENRFSRFDIRVAPDYLDEVLELHGAIRVLIWPVEFVGVLLATLIRGDSRRALLARR